VLSERGSASARPDNLIGKVRTSPLNICTVVVQFLGFAFERVTSN
jgi:hypothetical protein